MSNKQGDFIWYELMSKEPEKAREFYKAVAGLEIGEASVSSDGVDYRMISAHDGFMGGMLCLTKEMCKNGARPCWLGYVGVDDVDATVAELEADGGRVHLPARTMPGVGRIAMVADPQGAVFYLMRGEGEEESTVFRTREPGHVAWNELTSSDAVAAMKFYGNLLGWTKGEAMDMGDLGVYQMFQQQGNAIGAMMNSQNRKHPPFWLFYIAVADIDLAAAAVKSAGGKVAGGPNEVPGGDFVVVGQDPEGAVFALVGPRN